MNKLKTAPAGSPGSRVVIPSCRGRRRVEEVVCVCGVLMMPELKGHRVLGGILGLPINRWLRFVNMQGVTRPMTTRLEYK